MRIFSLIILVIIILLGDAITGFGATVSQPGDVQQFQQGICPSVGTNSQGSCSSCNIPDNTFPPVCNILVTFSKSFVAIPNRVDASFIGTNSSVAHTEFQYPLGSLPFQSDNGLTWTSMPAALTEIYGTTNHRAIADLTRIVSVAFSATCVNGGSNSGTAVLRPEYSVDNGATWTALGATTTNLDLGVGTQSICAFFAGGTPVSVGGIPVNGGSITANAKANGVWLRIVGIGGAGVGDNPSFNNIQLTLYGQGFQSATACILTVNVGGVAVCNLSGCGIGGDCSQCSNVGVTFVTVSKMCIQVSIDGPPFSSFLIMVQWSARLCINGGGAC